MFYMRTVYYPSEVIGGYFLWIEAQSITSELKIYNANLRRGRRIKQLLF
jgi:hypothetical protein